MAINPPDPEGLTPLMAACRDQPDTVPHMLASGADPNVCTPAGWTALAQAIEGLDRHSGPVLALVAAGARVTGQVRPVLPSACARARILEVLPALLEAGADLEEPLHGHTAVSVAALLQPQAVVVLLAAGADPEPLGRVLEKGGVACPSWLRALWGSWVAHRRLAGIGLASSEDAVRRL